MKTLWLHENWLSGEQQGPISSDCLPSRLTSSIHTAVAILWCCDAGKLPDDMGSAECLPALKALYVHSNPELSGECIE